MKEKIFAVYKPKGPTSHDVVDMIRKATGERRVGHAGTLDPLASGVLVIGVGREATRKLKEVVAAEKEYRATVRFGMTSTTDDEEGEKKEIRTIDIPSQEQIDKTLKKFVGKISQIPPPYSAIKINGKSAYKSARRGEVVALEPREVEIKKIDILEYVWPVLKLRVVTGPGVYIRALARDLGNVLSVGGYLANLERTRVGQFTKNIAVSISDISSSKLIR
jgi:tRNA pseudouridine55 synthase